jgi:hypothetical protein
MILSTHNRSYEILKYHKRLLNILLIVSVIEILVRAENKIFVFKLYCRSSCCLLDHSISNAISSLVLPVQTRIPNPLMGLALIAHVCVCACVRDETCAANFVLVISVRDEVHPMWNRNINVLELAYFAHVGKMTVT